MIFPFNYNKELKLAEVGGKAKALIQTTNAGMPVPEGIVLSVLFFHEWLQDIKASEVWKVMLQDMSKDHCDKVKTLAEEKRFTRTQKQIFEEKLMALNGQVFAVRSSSPEEDLEGSSFAGMYETYLGVTTDQLESVIAQAFSSCFDYRVMEYKNKNDIDLGDTSIAIIVQKQIASDVSGVGFSLNPLNNCYDEVFINASFGLGEAIVSGIVTPDTYIIDSVKKKIIEKQVKEKSISLWLRDSGGIEEKVNDEPNKQALADHQILELSTLIKKCEKHYQMPMDIEWAFENGKLDNIVITKNTEMVYYLYNDEDLQLIGIDKTTCSALKMNFVEGQIDDITFLVSPIGDVYPEDEIPLNDRTLKGFIWRIKERPETVEDLFDENDEADQFPEILKFQFPEESEKKESEKKS